MRSILMATAASLVLVAGAASADPGGNGKGGGNGNKGGGAAHSQNKGGGNKGGGQAKANKGNGGQKQAQKQAPQRLAQAGNGNSQKNANKGGGNGNGKAKAVVQAKGNSGNGGNASVKSKTVVKTNGNGNGNGNGAWKGNGNGNGNKARVVANGPTRNTNIRFGDYRDYRGQTIRVPVRDNVRVVTERRDRFDWDRYSVQRTAYKGCPPGLAKKYNGCTPPGLARRTNYSWSRPEWYFGDWNRSGYTYRYADGYLLRVNSGNSVLGFIPLLGGALSIGQPWPSGYGDVRLPDYYSSYYDVGPSYRYYDDTIYRVNSRDSSILSIAALLTGNDIAIGQPMPVGYDVYNVPYGYRDTYYDRPDARYRYSDGYIYQVDPTTQLVMAAIQLLT